MNTPTNPKLLRLAAIEREVRATRTEVRELRELFAQVLALKAQNAVLATMNYRLLGEKEKLLESLEILKQARKA